MLIPLGRGRKAYEEEEAQRLPLPPLRREELGLQQFKRCTMLALLIDLVRIYKKVNIFV